MSSTPSDPSGDPLPLPEGAPAESSSHRGSDQLPANDALPQRKRTVSSASDSGRRAHLPESAESGLEPLPEGIEVAAAPNVNASASTSADEPGALPETLMSSPADVPQTPIDAGSSPASPRLGRVLRTLGHSSKGTKLAFGAKAIAALPQLRHCQQLKDMARQALEKAGLPALEDLAMHTRRSTGLRKALLGVRSAEKTAKSAIRSICRNSVARYQAVQARRDFMDVGPARETRLAQARKRGLRALKRQLGPTGVARLQTQAVEKALIAGFGDEPAARHDATHVLWSLAGRVAPGLTPESVGALLDAA